MIGLSRKNLKKFIKKAASADPLIRLVDDEEGEWDDEEEDEGDLDTITPMTVSRRDSASSITTQGSTATEPLGRASISEVTPW
jgi:hypothetical protein